MGIEFSEQERLTYLVIMAGGGNRVLASLYRGSDEATRARIVAAMAAYTRELEPVMDAYGLKRDPEGLARAMMLTEDLIGCEPKGELASAGPDEAVRVVTSCPWAASYDGDTCRLVMAAVDEGLGRPNGLEVTCDQTMAEGAPHCVWRVRKKGP
jgi:hypothetical protein